MLTLSALVFSTVLISGVPLAEFAPDRHQGMFYHVLSRKVVSQDIHFQPGGAVHGITEDGCEFSRTAWQSSDGVGVNLEILSCKSTAHAQRVFNKLIGKATKVFEKKIITNKGRKTGGRVVATFTRELIKRPEMIVWTDGNKIYTVESTSFRHALIFEKKFPIV
jgi:hypothetical protein